MKAYLMILPVLLLVACNEAEQDAVEVRNDALQQRDDAVLRLTQVQVERDVLERQLAEERRLRELAEQDAEREVEREASFETAEATRVFVEDSPVPAAGDAPPVADFSMFYEGLDGFGQWFSNPDYGYVFQPTVSTRDRVWRPYTHGKWLYTDRGWTWVSDEPFGWATYHYGRWVLLDHHGWCWVPGAEWAPSWVAWRHGGGYVGWAPLPPETMERPGGDWGASVESDYGIADHVFIFIEERYMASPIIRHCLPVHRNRWLRSRARSCTNLHWRNGYVVAGGPSYSTLRHGVDQPWPVSRIENRWDTDHHAPRGTVHDGDAIRVFAPDLAVSTKNHTLRPNRVAGRFDRGELAGGGDRGRAHPSQVLLEKQRQAQQRPREVTDRDRDELPQGVLSGGDQQQTMEELRKRLEKVGRPRQMRPTVDKDPITSRPSVERPQKLVQPKIPSRALVNKPSKKPELRPVSDKVSVRDRAAQLRRAEQERLAKSDRLREQQREVAGQQQRIEQQRRVKQQQMEQRRIAVERQQSAAVQKQRQLAREQQLRAAAGQQRQQDAAAEKQRQHAREQQLRAAAEQQRQQDAAADKQRAMQARQVKQAGERRASQQWIAQQQQAKAQEAVRRAANEQQARQEAARKEVPRKEEGRRQQKR